MKAKYLLSLLSSVEPNAEVGIELSFINKKGKECVTEIDIKSVALFPHSDFRDSKEEVVLYTETLGNL